MIPSPSIRIAALSSVLLAASVSVAAPVIPDSCNLPEPELATYLVTDQDSKSETVNIRAQPNTRAAVLAVCDNFGEAAILGKSGAWYRVRLAVNWDPTRIISGYVHQSQVSLRHIYTVHSADGSAILRLEPNKYSDNEGRFPNGTRVIERPAGRKGDWLYVELPGSDSNYFGYMHKSQIRPKAGR
ncbi:SH3 domain-containing protein [Eikenella sp. S3360]|uniref:SH3 domain-containing protein n=1 Tax=Eikenella glucosivorans TaxID=2766967 RepID=A0ABS0NA56_9NEIS|nr:SH3 domain-containing protein [Eikenella glucosivorans]MBH5329187.1 SH3 domain-containing protein [Eikenella glucosivorans]